MIYQYNVLKARVKRLETLINNLEKFNLEFSLGENNNSEEAKIKEFTKDNLNTHLKEFSKNIYDSLLAFNELNICINKNKTNDLYERPIRKITNILNERKYIKDRETLIKKAKELISIISDYLEDEFKEYDYNFKALCYYDNSLEYVVTNGSDMIKNLINLIGFEKAREFTSFYPNCNGAYNFNCEVKNLLKYGTDSNSLTVYEAKESYTRVIYGSISDSKIKNNAFDILYIQPIVVNGANVGTIKGNSTENEYIINMFKYLREGGVAITLMPFTRLSEENCKMFSRYLKNIQIFKADEEDFKNIGLVYIVGQKKKNRNVEPKEYIKLRASCLVDNIKEFNIINLKDYNKYTLPRAFIEIDIFRGGILDDKEIESIFKNSTLKEKVYENEVYKPIYKEEKQPLLPLNLGQLGLVLTSGCLDGIVNEENGFAHLIKGRVEKRTLLKKVDDDDTIKNIATTFNNIEINILMPDGELKVLS